MGVLAGIKTCRIIPGHLRACIGGQVQAEMARLACMGMQQR